MSCYKLIEESRWFKKILKNLLWIRTSMFLLVIKILMISLCTVQFSKDHVSSVMICVEDG